MKGDKTIIKHLNVILRNELTAINQYFLHSRMYENWGATKLAKKQYEESIEEMQHADLLIKRILFLEGLPNLQEMNKMHVGETIKECIEGDLALEHKGHDDLKKAIAYAESVQDYVSKQLFIQILTDEEKHTDFLETLLEQIKLIGVQNFIQLQSGSADQAED
jgi:bacterioferritin